jgi:hypothetical protein
MAQACVCPDCRTWFEAGDGARTARCPSCGRRVSVEAARLASPPEPEAPLDYDDFDDEDEQEYAYKRESVEPVAPNPAARFQLWDCVSAIAFALAGIGLIVGLKSAAGIVIGLVLVAFAVASARLTHFWTTYGHLSKWEVRLARGPRYVFQGAGMLVVLAVGLFGGFAC